MELAVIKTGGKQYLISPQQRIQIERIKKKEGEEIIFDEVLLAVKEDEVKIGTPFVDGVKVVGKVLGETKGKKIVIWKHKTRQSARIKKGHRQKYTLVEIVKFLGL